MVLGLPCQFDYRDVTYAFHRTFGHLLPRRLQNRDVINGPYDRGYDDYPPTSPGGYNTSIDQIGKIQAREHELVTAGNISGADVYYPGGSEREGGGSLRNGVSKKEVRWDQGVVGGEETGSRKSKRASISRVV
ncbi:hypothetical protein TWF281_011298 [Arthrobotrys megalospora]